MNKKMIAGLVASSVFSVPVWADGTKAITVGIGKTDYELSLPNRSSNQVFTSTDWTDVDLVYTYRTTDKFFFNIGYRTAINAEHDTFSAGTSDLEDERISITIGAGALYVGYLNYSTNIIAPSTSTSNSVEYELYGFTTGLQFSNGISDDDAHRFQWGGGLLFAEAELTQGDYNPDYDLTMGYFLGAGFSGPLGSSGFAYSLKYEYQKINLDATYDTSAVELDDKRTRISAALTYVFL